MPEPSVSAELLSDLIEGRPPRFGEQAAEAELARLARACRDLVVPGPSPQASQRLLARFEAVTSAPRWQWWQGWVSGATRPLAQRMAAGALLLAATGGSASVATGVSPQEFAADAASFVRSVVVNLVPDGEGGGDAAQTPTTGTPTSTLTPTPTATPTATTTPPPTNAGAIASPDPEPEDDDETRTPEPGDDNGGDRPDGESDDRSGSNSGSGNEDSD